VTKSQGSREYSEVERELTLSLIADYMIFRVKDHEMLKLINQRLKRNMSYRTFTYLKREAVKRQGEAGEWLQDFAMVKMADFYRTRIDEMEYIQKQLLLIFEEEASKTEKKNKYLMDKLAKTIGENSKILADFGMAPPIVAKIKQMLPLDINDLNDRITAQKEEVKKYIKDKAIDSNSIQDNDLHEGQSTEETEIEHSELDRLLEYQKQAKSGFSLSTDNAGNRRTTEDAGDEEDQRIF
jgi:hypothetical protein